MLEEEHMKFFNTGRITHHIGMMNGADKNHKRISALYDHHSRMIEVICRGNKDESLIYRSSH